MDDNTENNIEKPQKLKKLPNHKVQTVIVVLLLLMVSGGIYLWQNSKVKSLNSQLSDLKDTNSNLNDTNKTQGEKIIAQIAKISDLEKQILPASQILSLLRMKRVQPV